MNTAAQIGDLEVVPRHRMEYRGTSFEEMDIDALLARKPAVALVDELAHTNVPGSRNEKRWQDVEELLDAGIDVISTVNIQHLESMNDVVEAITGIEQQEKIPDAVVRAADQVELIDQTPEALRRRMAHGNIYAAGEGRRGAGQLLPRGQPRRAPRARAHVGRGPGRRGAGGVPRAPRHLGDVGDPRAGRRRDHGRARRRGRAAPGRAHGDAHPGRAARCPRAARRRARRAVRRAAERAPPAADRARRPVPRDQRRRRRRGADRVRPGRERQPARDGCEPAVALERVPPRLRGQRGAPLVRADRRARHLDRGGRRRAPASRCAGRSDARTSRGDGSRSDGSLAAARAAGPRGAAVAR